MAKNTRLRKRNVYVPLKVNILQSLLVKNDKVQLERLKTLYENVQQKQKVKVRAN